MPEHNKTAGVSDPGLDYEGQRHLEALQLQDKKTGIPAEAGDRLAEALRPLQGHPPGHSLEEAALRIKSAQEVRRPAPRAPVISAADFQNAVTSSYPFGLSAVAAGLRKLADAVEAGKVNPQRVTVSSNGPRDDFHETTLTVVYNDLQSAP